MPFTVGRRVVGRPAFGVLLSPVFAAVVALSSVFVLGSALRLC